MENEESFVEKDFIYMGRRMDTSYKVSGAIQVDGKTRIYGIKNLRHKVIGGIYRGASFTENRVMGLADAKYKGRIEDRELIVTYEARDMECMRTQADRKHEADDKKGSEIGDALLNVRKAYARAVKFHDFGLMHALERSVVQWLKIPPAKGEE